MKYVGNIRYRLVDVEDIFGVRLVKWWYSKRKHKFYVDVNCEQEFIQHIKTNL